MELIGRVNEADIFVGDIWIMVLIDMEAQVSTITQEICKQHGYDIHPMEQMLCLEGMGEFSIPYLGYIEATIRIPPIKNCEKCVPMLVLKSSSPFSLRIPVQLGTTVLDRAMAKITVEELVCASSMWQQTYMGTVARTVEMKNDDTPYINVPLVMTKPTVIPLFGCK